MVDIIYILSYLAQVLNPCRVHSASLMLAELHNEHYTFMSFNKKLMLTYILLIECILIVHSTLLHLALLWGLKYHKVHRNSQKINNFFFAAESAVIQPHGTSTARKNYNKHNCIIY